MITAAATATDFQAWETRALTMTDAELLYTVRDCQKAAEAMKGFNPDREGYYIDQACTYGMELTRRRRSRR